MTKAITAEEAAAAYLTGLSLSEIGAMFGCHAQTVLNRLRAASVPLRSVSESLKGRRITWADKIGEAQRGKVISPEQRKKLSLACMGRPAPNKGKRKATHPDEIRYGMPGAAHWNWKGGISPENTRLRQSSEYKAWRQAVFARDNWTCQKCGKRGGAMEADHIKLFSRHPELRFAVENGRTLCKAPCHRDETRRVLYGS